MTGWEHRPLGLLCSIARGGSPRPIRQFLTDASDGVNWIKISDATASGRYIYRTAEKIKPAGVARSRLVKDGDFLLSNSMSFGRPYIMRTSGCIHDGWLVLSDYQKTFDQTFLYYVLGSPQVFSQFDRLAAGSTVRNLNIDLASRVVVPAPPLPEQRRIVAILDEAFEAIATAKANTEKNLQNARELFRSEAKSLFLRGAAHWPIKTVDKLSTNLDSKRVPTTKSDRKAGEFPYYGASGIVDYVADYIFEGDALLVSEDGANLLARSTPIAFSVRGRYWVNNHAHILKFANMATQKFVEFYLESIPLEEYITGAAQPKLNQKALNSIPIPVPTNLDEQEQVVDRLERSMEQSEQLQSVYGRKLNALDELKKSLLHQAFSGRLTAKIADTQLEAVA